MKIALLEGPPAS